MRALCVDDDTEIQEVMKFIFLLHRPDATVATADDGRSALHQVLRESPDIVILDIGLPDMDGYEVCSRIREFSRVPILMLTIRRTDLEKVKGLEGGADDYLSKPFSSVELLARVQALLRRAPPATTPEKPTTYQVAGLHINFDTGLAEYGDRHVNLTASERELLWLLVFGPSQQASREMLETHIWPPSNTGSSDRLSLLIHRTRRRLQGLGLDGELVEACHGGYLFRNPLEEDAEHEAVGAAESS